MFSFRLLAPSQIASLCIAMLIVAPPAPVHAGQFIEASRYPISQTLSSANQILVADFNLDGNPDLAFGVSFPDGIWVMLGSASGQFSPPLTLSLPAVGYIATADFNNDGKPDIAVVDYYGQTVTILAGKGDGTFQVLSPFSVPIPNWVEAGDVNGDGNTDLVVVDNASFTGYGVNVLLGNGDGTFQTPSFYPTAHLPLEIHLADLNADGNLDIVTVDNANGRHGFLSVLLGNGDGTFQPYTTVNFPEFVAMLVIADLNADGIPDLLESNDVDTLTIELGRGDGTFGIAFTYPKKVYSAIVADFNQDGKLDLTVAVGDTGAASIWFGNGDGSFQPRDADYGAVGRLFAGDFNHDGIMDLVTPLSSRLDVLFGRPDGTLAASRTFLSGSYAPTRLQAADFNGDGVLDLLLNSFGTRAISVLRGTGGSFRTPLLSDVGALQSDVAIGDFNHDGVLDVVSANNLASGGAVGVALGKGNGAFRFPKFSKLPLQPSYVAVGDFNHDGNLDVAVTEWKYLGGHADVSVLLGNGDGTLQKPTRYPLTGPANALAVADVNGDHNPDLVAANGNAISVFLGKGDGTFSAPTDSNSSAYVLGIALGDMNEDGKVDVVVANQNSVAIMLGSGDGTFQTPSQNYAPGGASVCLTDLNRDGHLDVVTSDRSRLGNGDGTLRPGEPIYSGALSAADFDGDGYPDVAAPHFNYPSPDTVSVALNKGGRQPKAGNGGH